VAVGAAPDAGGRWSRKHLVAHLAANADALGHLVRWAATGEPTPMYSSPGERAAGIERGTRLPARDLAAWLRGSARTLEEGMAGLSGGQWQASVLTAQGRTVPASEVPWLRSREVWVHAVDFATGLSFADLPGDFLTALCGDVAGKRAAVPGPAPGRALTLEATGTGGRWELPGPGEPITVTGPLAEITAYLTGRAHHLVTADGAAVPAWPAWL
jgi:uncharacterized protein (TIGR03083 family)